MTAYHISLYLALLREWSARRFSERVAISRDEMMDLTRIGSANTYARCVKEPNKWDPFAIFRQPMATPQAK